MKLPLRLRAEWGIQCHEKTGGVCEGRKGVMVPRRGVEVVGLGFAHTAGGRAKCILISEKRGLGGEKDSQNLQN